MTKSIEAKNLTAQMQYRAAGNPPSTLPSSTVSNCYPGLELDFRNAWKQLLVGIELHESSNFVVGVDPDAPDVLKDLVNGYRLKDVGGAPTMAPVFGPSTPGGAPQPLKNWSGETQTFIEWSNALVKITSQFGGQSVLCIFQSVDGKPDIAHTLTVRRFFDTIEVAGAQEQVPVIARDLAPAGALTQSLCAPWQYDYRYCACFYWAATRPDYVNVEPRADGTSAGNNWMEKDRTPESPKVYINDDFQDPRLVTTQDLMTGWERSLRFVLRGIDEPPPPKKPEPAK